MASIDEEPDRISSLPGDVIDRILSLMPIKDAVRTSTLSNKWRYKWATLPNLVFGRQGVSASYRYYSDRKLLTTIDHVLLLHFGQINKFKLSHVGPISASALDRWIAHLIKMSFKELDLKVGGQPYKIPWCLFSCQSLHHITLYDCWLKPPSTIEGFKNLKSLNLDHVIMAQDSFENLISGCPLLEKLIVTELDVFTQINIHAPNLKVLHIKGNFTDISFENTFQLIDVLVVSKWYLNSESNTSRLHGSSTNLLKLFAHLHHVHKLDFSSGYFLKYLAAGDVPEKLPTPCINLTHLWLNINFTDLKEISIALCVFRSSPNLKELRIFPHHEKHAIVLPPSSYVRDVIFLGPDMPIGVQYIWIEGISGTEYELDFIRFLLQYSPILKQMTVKPVKARPELILQLLRIKRASTEAEIIYKGNTRHCYF